MGCCSSKAHADVQGANGLRNGLDGSRNGTRLGTIPKRFTDSLVSKNVSNARIRTDARIDEIYLFEKQVLGSGFSGEVRVAVHKVTGRKVAVKTLSTTNLSPKRASMLHNEVSIYLSLDHPNIARLYEVFEDDNAVHLVMELCTGKELYDRLLTKKKYSEGDAAKIIRQMLAAINYCHHKKICHRDLKLENWVFADESEDAPLKLIDFGFSRIFMKGVPMTAMHGTVYYVSPEVLEGCYSEQCDIWSIGVIIYMLLSGSPPFGGSNDAEILQKIRVGQFSFNGPRWQGISQEARSFIRALLQQDPQLRPSAAEALKLPWLAQATTPVSSPNTTSPSSPTEIDLDVLRSMSKFAAANHIKRAALCLLAYSLSPSEVVELEASFLALDSERTGTLSLQDITNVLMHRLGITESEASKVFEKLNQSGDHQISYSEFLAATLALKVQINDDIARQVFERFDVQHRGFFTAADLRHVLGDSYNGVPVEDIIRVCDVKRTGDIGFEEFKQVFLANDEPVRQLSRGYSTEGLDVALDRGSTPSATNRNGLGVLGFLNTSEVSMQNENDDLRRKVSNNLMLFGTGGVHSDLTRRNSLPGQAPRSAIDNRPRVQLPRLIEV